MTEQIEQIKRFGFKITVFSNRVEITDKRGCFGFVLPKNTSIPIRSITSVDVARATSRLIIRTNDGKEHKYPVGGSGANKIREAILDQM